MDDFSAEVLQKLGCYVYSLVDPRKSATDPRRLVYVGKGTGRRCFHHAASEVGYAPGSEPHPKLELIREIRNATGNPPPIEILCWGLSDVEALGIEAILIGTLKTDGNLVRGYSASDICQSAEGVEGRFANPLPVTELGHRVLLVSLNGGGNLPPFPEIADADLPRRVLMYWPLSERNAATVEYIIGVYQQLTRCVFKVHQREDGRASCKRLKLWKKTNGQPNWKIQFSGERCPEKESIWANRRIISNAGELLTKFPRRVGTRLIGQRSSHTRTENTPSTFAVYGIDFTSTPTARKPLTCAHAKLTGDRLSIERIESWSSFTELEAFLHHKGPWRAGFDFPFSQPRRLLENLGRAADWESAVKWLTSGRTRKEFEQIFTKYRKPRPKGDRQHLRATDTAAKSCSPMMFYGVPVAKMFFEGAPRLLNSDISILPMHPRSGETRVAVEAYPKLVAQRYANGGKYKADERKKQTAAMRATRERILTGIQSHAPRDYGLHVQICDTILADAIDDQTGDTLDAILCAVQAAWSHHTPTPPNGIPATADRLEGWIVDPGLLT